MSPYQWITTDFAAAFMSMLLNSLWIGVIAALLAGVIVLTTRKTTALIRYNLLLWLYSVAISSVVFALIRQLILPRGAERVVSTTESGTGADIIAFPSSPIIFSEQSSSLFTSITSFMDHNSTLIISVWLYIFAFKLLKMIFGLRYVHTLQHKNVYGADKRWRQWTRQKALELGVRRRVRLLQSELVKIPVVIGHLKPVVLVPLGLLSRLSPLQVEAILIHELAHVRRKDYLINLLQTLTDAVFFFNPAFLWISSLIRQEREKCCDDIVVAHIDRSEYLRALVSFQEMTYGEDYAMALGRAKHSLLNRVKRMLTKENSKLSLPEASMLVAGMMAISFSFMAFTSKDTVALSAPAARLQMPQESVAAVTSTATVVEKKKHRASFKTLVQKRNDTLPTKPTPAKEAFNFKEIISNISDDGTRSIYQLQATTTEGTIYKIRKEQGQIISISVNGKEVDSKDYPNYYPVINAIEQRRSQQAASRYRMMEKSNVDRHNKSIARQNKQVALQEKIALQNQKRLLRQDSIKRNSLKPKFKAYQSYKVPTRPYKPYPVYQSSTNATITAIIRDLQASNLVSGSDFSFSLTDKEFVVNGERQSEEVLQRFRSKYLKDPENRFSYLKKGGTTRTEVYVK